jgi:hypothetical protein
MNGRTESPLFQRLRELEDPRPHLSEAKDALGKILAVQKDLFLLDIEIRTMNQLKRLAYGVAAVLFLTLTLGMGFGWASWALHQRGWSPWILSLASLAIFGGLSLLFVNLAKNVGAEEESEESL